MNLLLRIAAIPLALAVLTAAVIGEDEKARHAELDAYWAEVSRTVKEGDFEGYAAGCHEEAVFVSGIKMAAYPLSKALARWKQEFVDTKAGKRISNVTFRFSQRLGDATTAHETGIFVYSFQQGTEEPRKEFIHFEALLVKKQGGWKILMEYQKSAATEAEWAALR